MLVNVRWWLCGCICCCCTLGMSFWPVVCLNKGVCFYKFFNYSILLPDTYTIKFRNKTPGLIFFKGLPCTILSFLVYYLLWTLSQVGLGLKIDFCKLKLCLQISLTCQMVSFGHLDTIFCWLYHQSDSTCVLQGKPTLWNSLHFKLERN